MELAVCLEKKLVELFYSVDFVFCRENRTFRREHNDVRNLLFIIFLSDFVLYGFVEFREQLVVYVTSESFSLRVVFVSLSVICFIQIKFIDFSDNVLVAFDNGIHDFINHRAVPFFIAGIFLLGCSPVFFFFIRESKKSLADNITEFCFSCVYVIRIKIAFC